MKKIWFIILTVYTSLITTSVYANTNYGLTGNENIQSPRAIVIGSNGEKNLDLEKKILGKIELINYKYRIEIDSGPEAIFQINARYLQSYGSYIIFLRCNCIKAIEDPYTKKKVMAIIWGETDQMGQRSSFKSTEESILDFTASCYEDFLSDYLKSKKQ